MHLFQIIVTSLFYNSYLYAPFYKYLFYVSVIYQVCIMRLLVYMLVNVNGIYYVHVSERVRRARSAGNSATENLRTMIIILYPPPPPPNPVLLLLCARARVRACVCVSARVRA